MATITETTSFGCRWLSRPQVWLRLVLALVLAIILTGCRKHRASDDSVAGVSPADTSATQTAAVPPPYMPPPAPLPPVAASPDGGADLRQLNHIYIGWIVANHRRVKTFEEFVTASGVQVPPAPSGKKYMIDHNGFIALENQ